MEFNEQLYDAIQKSEYILIGIGEEFEINALEMLNSDLLITNTQKLPNTVPDHFFKDVIMADYYEKYHSKRLLSAYEKLLDLVKDKKYFMVSLNKDRLPLSTGFDQNCVVFPMGGYTHLQCSNNCQKAVIDSKEYIDYFLKYFEEYDQISQEDIPTYEQSFSVPKCPFCGSELSFNYYGNDNSKEYCEAGYIDRWQDYLQFLQKTINHSLCVIELGVSSRFPTVVRLPFEKTVFFNKKSLMFRIHSYDCNISEDIQDKCFTLKENALDFIRNL